MAGRKARQAGRLRRQMSLQRSRTAVQKGISSILRKSDGKGRKIIMTTSMITEDLVKTIIGKRNREIHKGDCGRILISAGSRGMAGAAVLSATAALRAGSGLVQMAIPDEIFPIVQTGIPEATCLSRDFTKIDLGRFDAAAAGPGMGEGEESVRSVLYLIENFGGPLVLDADALNIIAHRDLFEKLRQRKPGTTVITPHAGEAKRLLGRDGSMESRQAAMTENAGMQTAMTETERHKMAKDLRQKTGAITILKGHGTLVALNDDGAYTNTTGNPGMATAGSGDVLTGIITSLAGQKKPSGQRITAAEAAICGVFIHGMAGDLAAESMGEYGLIAGDIAYHTALALKKISG